LSPRRCNEPDGGGGKCLLVEGHPSRHCSAGPGGWHYFGEPAEGPAEPPPEPPRLDADALAALVRCLAEPGALDVAFTAPSAAALGLLGYAHELVRLAGVGLASEAAGRARKEAPDSEATPRLSADVVPWLRDRHAQWQSASPWYRQGPLPVEVVPLYLTLERAIRAQRAEIKALGDEVAEACALVPWPAKPTTAVELARRAVDKHAALASALDAAVARAEAAERLAFRGKTLLDRAVAAEWKLGEERARWAMLISAGYADAAAAIGFMMRQSERIIDLTLAEEKQEARAVEAEKDATFYREKHEEWTRGMVRILGALLEAGVKLPTDEEEEAGRTIDVFVRELARDYKRTRLALAMLQNEREVRVGEVASYRAAICYETTCLTCGHLYPRLHELEESVRSLVATMPRCVHKSENKTGCERPATQAFTERSEDQYCDEHVPTRATLCACRDLVRASALRHAAFVLAEQPPPFERVELFRGSFFDVSDLPPSRRGIAVNVPVEGGDNLCFAYANAEAIARLGKPVVGRACRVVLEWVDPSRAAAQTDSQQRDRCEKALGALCDAAQAAIEGWRAGDDVAGPMFDLRDALDRASLVTRPKPKGGGA
jgi:hypothetical protein